MHVCKYVSLNVWLSCWVYAFDRANGASCFLSLYLAGFYGTSGASGTSGISGTSGTTVLLHTDALLTRIHSWSECFPNDLNVFQPVIASSSAFHH